MIRDRLIFRRPNNKAVFYLKEMNVPFQIFKRINSVTSQDLGYSDIQKSFKIYNLKHISKARYYHQKNSLSTLQTISNYQLASGTKFVTLLQQTTVGVLDEYFHGIVSLDSMHVSLSVTHVCVHYIFVSCRSLTLYY